MVLKVARLRPTNRCMRCECCQGTLVQVEEWDWPEDGRDVDVFVHCPECQTGALWVVSVEQAGRLAEEAEHLTHQLLDSARGVSAGTGVSRWRPALASWARVPARCRRAW